MFFFHQGDISQLFCRNEEEPMVNDIEDSDVDDGEESDFDADDAVLEQVDNEFDTLQEEHHGIWSNKHVRCIVHSLQLIVRNFEKKDGKSVIQAAIRLVNQFRKSTILTSKLKTAGNGTVLRPHNVTRWSSLYRLIDRLLELEEPVKSVCISENLDGLLPSQWNSLKQVRQLLEPFAEHTLALEANSSTTISLVVPAVQDLETHLQNVSCFIVSLIRLKYLKTGILSLDDQRRDVQKRSRTDAGGFETTFRSFY